jgi:sulfur carrier protein
MTEVKIFFIGFPEKEKSIEIPEGSTYIDLLNIFNINPETVIIVKDGSPVPLDDKVEKGEIRVMRVISGG